MPRIPKWVPEFRMHLDEKMAELGANQLKEQLAAVEAELSNERAHAAAADERAAAADERAAAAETESRELRAQLEKMRMVRWQPRQPPEH